VSAPSFSLLRIIVEAGSAHQKDDDRATHWDELSSCDGANGVARWVCPPRGKGGLSCLAHQKNTPSHNSFSRPPLAAPPALPHTSSTSRRVVPHLVRRSPLCRRPGTRAARKRKFLHPGNFSR
jgi:hypothetical protein